jgi:hypothetical protein
MKTSKEKRQKDYMSDLVEINLKGIDTGTISENLNSLGVDTIKLDLNLYIDQANKMETWTKEEWANSYKGSILTFDGTEVITDKEISSKVTELEGKFQKNTLNIENKRIELVNLNTQLDPLNSELQSLNEKKSLLTSQYNAEISKLSIEDLSSLETQKSIELSEKLKNELENVTSEGLKAEQQSALLKTEISSLNKTLNEQILQSNKTREDINNLNSNKLELHSIKNQHENLNAISKNHKLENSAATNGNYKYNLKYLHENSNHLNSKQLGLHSIKNHKLENSAATNGNYKYNLKYLHENSNHLNSKQLGLHSIKNHKLENSAAATNENYKSNLKHLHENSNHLNSILSTMKDTNETPRRFYSKHLSRVRNHNNTNNYISMRKFKKIKPQVNENTKILEQLKSQDKEKLEVQENQIKNLKSELENLQMKTNEKF